MPHHNARRIPRIPRSRILVAVARHVDYELRCARAFGLGCEVQAFSFPDALEGDFMRKVRRVAKRVASLHGTIGCHGAFIDTLHCSPDPEVRAVARRRYLQSFDIAEAVGARYVLFHSQYNSMIKIPEYPNIYHRESMKFWPDVVAEAERRGIRIYIENMFDMFPEPMRRVADALDSSHFRLCLDVAHATLHSDMSVAQWIESFGPYLAHIHVNDTRGTYDDHLGLGQGGLNLAEALTHIENSGLAPTYALETNTNTRASLKYLGIAPL